MCKPDSRYIAKTVSSNAFVFNGQNAELRNYSISHNNDLALSFTKIKNGGNYRLLVTKTTSSNKTITVTGATIVGSSGSTITLSGTTGTKFWFEISNDGTTTYISQIASVAGGSGTPLSSEDVMDIVGTLIQDSNTIDATYNDTLDKITLEVNSNFGTKEFYGNLAKIVTIEDPTYTLSDADCGKVLRFTSSSAITLTLPAAITLGFNCVCEQFGTGQITRALGAGATCNNRQGHTKTAGQYACISFIVTSNNASNTAGVYNLTGDTA